MRRVEGPRRAQSQLKKTFKGPRRRRGSCWEERKWIVFPDEGSLICPPDKSMILFKKETEKNWVGGQTWCWSTRWWCRPCCPLGPRTRRGWSGGLATPTQLQGQGWRDWPGTWEWCWRNLLIKSLSKATDSVLVRRTGRPPRPPNFKSNKKKWVFNNRTVKVCVSCAKDKLEDMDVSLNFQTRTRGPWFLQDHCDLKGGHISNPETRGARWKIWALSFYWYIVVHCRSSGLVTIFCQSDVIFWCFHKMTILSMRWKKKDFWNKIENIHTQG